MGLLDLFAAVQQSPLGGLLGMGAPPPAPAPMAAPAPAAAGLPASLVGTESGGNWSALNSEGYGGRGQFGDARLMDAYRAGVIDHPMTGAEYSQAPEAVQLAVENWQRNDILGQLGKYVGTDVDGGGPIPPLTPDSLVAVAHLGGIPGARRFIESGGRYNPADSNGTHLSEYATTHAGGSRAPTAMAFADPGAGSMSNASTSSPSTGSTPMGLLSMPPEPERRPTIWDRFDGTPGLGWLADPERRARLSIAMEGMRLNPNEALIQQMQGRIEDASQKEQQQRLAAWLASQDNPTAQNLGAMIAAGLDGSAASSLLGAMQPPQPEYMTADGRIYAVQGGQATPLTPGPAGPQYMTGAEVAGMFPGVQVQDPSALYVMGQDGLPKPVEGTGAAATQQPTDDMLEYEAAKAQGYQGTLQDWIMDSRRAGATTVTVGGEGQNIGTIPQGYAVVPDQSNPSGFRMEAIPGGPEDTSAQTAATQNAQAIAGNVVLSAATRARDAHRQGVGGVIGAGLSYFPGSSDAEVYRQVDVLKSNATIEALNAMRQQSPTGGALGNVTEGEGQMLAARAGALDPKSSTFERDLADYTRALLRTIHGVEAGDRIFAEQYGGDLAASAAPATSAADIPPPPPVPAGARNPTTGQPITPEEWAAAWAKMTPEQRAAFQ